MVTPTPKAIPGSVQGCEPRRLFALEPNCDQPINDSPQAFCNAFQAMLRHTLRDARNTANHFGAKMIKIIRTTAALGLMAVTLCQAPARADDPKDPAMQTREAREADAAEIRRLNLAEAAYVRERDARYAQDWQAWREARDASLRHSVRSSHTSGEDRLAYEDTRSASQVDRQTYESARRDYEAAMADWRRNVAACRGGDYQRCSN